MTLDSARLYDRPESSGTAAEALAVQDIRKRFADGDWAVDGVSLSVRQGEILSVLGPSGCGKTTLLRLVGGFEEPDRGQVLQEGRVISRPGWVLPPEERRIGMVFQEYTLFPHLTVRENVQFGLQPSLGERVRGWLRGGGDAASKAAGPEAARLRERAERLQSKRGLVRLMEICGLGELTERYPHELSGGQQQRVALARALATGPELLLLDEPFSSLDSSLRQHLRQEVRAILRKAGTTTILVTHDQEEAINMGDRLAVMNHGRLEQVGSPAEVLERPVNRFVARFIGWNRFLPGTVRDGAVQTELGRFPVPSGSPDRGAVDVLLRPAQVHLASNGDGVPAEVLQVQYLGGQPLYTLRLPSGQEILALLPQAEALEPGRQAGLRFDPRPLVVYPAE